MAFGRGEGTADRPCRRPEFLQEMIRKRICKSSVISQEFLSVQAKHRSAASVKASYDSAQERKAGRGRQRKKVQWNNCHNTYGYITSVQKLITLPDWSITAKPCSPVFSGGL